jgi:2-polyprenyl-3-methyl-5-hydroxy-6-metoxy-1,4-benzoquinol methylase
MHEEIIKAQRDNALTLRYNRWIFETIRPYLGKRIMDAGAGCGNFTGMLADGREALVAVELLEYFAAELERVYASRPNVSVACCSLEDQRLAEIGAAAAVDTIVCNNVLEHIADDRRALRNMHAALPAGGRLVLIVPAFAAL